MQEAQTDRGPLIDGVGVIRFFWQNKIIIVAPALAAALLLYFVTFLFEPWYRSTTTVLPSRQLDLSGARSDLTGSLGGLAQLAGLGDATSGRQREAIATLKSRHLAGQFIQKHGLTDVFVDTTAINQDTDESEKDLLVRAERYFSKNVLTISEDRKTGMLQVSVDWIEPARAAIWANSYVSLANSVMKSKAIDEAEKSIVYLEKEIKLADSVDLRRLLYTLVQRNVQTIALARASDDYAFLTIDPAMVPSDADIISPRRLVIAVLAMFIGGFVGLVAATVRH